MSFTFNSYRFPDEIIALAVRRYLGLRVPEFSVVDAIMRMGTCILPGALAQLEDASCKGPPQRPRRAWPTSAAPRSRCCWSSCATRRGPARRPPPYELRRLVERYSREGDAP
jgi:hypothetical protein